MIETIWEIMVNLLESTIFILFFTRIFSVRSIYTSYRHFGIFGAYYYRNGYHVFCNINNMNMVLFNYCCYYLICYYSSPYLMAHLLKRCMYPYSLR